MIPTPGSHHVVGTMTATSGSSLAARAVWNAGSGVALIAGRFLAGLIVARRLGPEGSGQLAYFLWLADMGAVVLHAALPAALTRFEAELRGANDFAQAAAVRRWVRARFVGLLLASAVVLVFAARHSSALNALAFAVLLPTFYFAQSLWTLGQADLAGRGLFSISARVNVFTAFVLVTAVAIGATFGGAVGAAIGYLVGAGTQALAGLLFTREHTAAATLRPEVRRALMRYAGATWLAGLLSAFAWGRVEVFFLERYCGAAQVAMFTVGLSLVTLFAQGAVLLADALTPHFAGLVGAGRRADISPTYCAATRLLGLLILPCTLGGAAIVPVLLPWLYGPAFAPAVGVASVLTAGASLQVAVVGGTLIYGLGRANFIAITNACWAVVVVIAGVIIIPIWAAMGAAIARVTIQTLGVAVGFWFVQTRLACDVPWRALAKTAVAALGCAIAAAVLVHAWPRPPVLLAAVPLGAMVYVAAIRILRVVHAEDVARLAVLSRTAPAPLDVLWQRTLGWVTRA